MYLDSLRLPPGWEYNLNVIKHIHGAEDFLNLKDSVKDCQIDTIDNCTTRSYVDRVRRKCGCLPISMTIPGQEKETKSLIYLVLNILKNEFLRFLYVSLTNLNVSRRLKLVMKSVSIVVRVCMLPATSNLSWVRIPLLTFGPKFRMIT